MSPRRKNRWYGAEGQANVRQLSAQQTGGMKRLLGLVVLLILVLILIQKASDAKRVEQVGKAIGLFEQKTIPQNTDSTTSTLPTSVSTESLENVSLDGQGLTKPTAAMQWTWEQLQLKSTDADQSVRQQIWMRLIAIGQTEGIAEKMIEWLNHATDESEPLDPGAWANLAAEQLGAWIELLSEETNSVENLERLKQMRSELLDLDAFLRRDPKNEQLDAKNIASRKAFEIALDRSLLGVFRDGEPWRASERIASLRQWKRCGLLRSAIGQSIQFREVPRVEVMQLVSNNNGVYRGVPVRFRGTIAQIDARSGELAAPGWESNSYQVFWLKPDEASNQPVPIYVPKEALPAGWEPEKDTLIEAVGIFGKKVAYASQRGPELAPVLFVAAIQSPQQTDAPEGAYSQWVRNGSAGITWTPPKDFRAPYSLMLQTAYPLLSRFRDTDWESGENPVPEVALALLMESSKLAPEIQFLCEADQAWSLGDKLKVTYRYGIVEEVERLPIKELAKLQKNSQALAAMDRAEQKFVYRLRVSQLQQYLNHSESESPRGAATVYANQVPAEWLPEKTERIRTIRQPGYLAGYCWGNRAPNDDSLDTFVVDRVGWKSKIGTNIAEGTTTSSDNKKEWSPPLRQAEQRLLERGWDLANRELLRSLQTPVRPLSSSELEPLYSLLKQEAESATEMTADEVSEKSLGEWIQSALARQENALGRPAMVPVRWNARIIRITRIPVEDAREREWLGADQYFQLDCMGDIGNKSFELPTGKDPIVYYKEYPVTCLVRNLPNTLPEKLLRWAANGPLSGGDTSKENLEADVDVLYPRLRVQCSGWLYRFWSYRTVELSEAMGNQHRQVSPLMVAAQMAIGTAPAESQNTASNPMQTWQWIIGLVGVAGVWWYIRKAMRPKPRKMSK